MEREFIYKDTKIYAIEHNGRWELTSRRCICCNQPIKNGKALLVINNYKHIPNIIIHTECFNKYDGNYNELFSIIETEWQHYKDMREVFY